MHQLISCPTPLPSEIDRILQEFPEDSITEANKQASTRRSPAPITLFDSETWYEQHLKKHQIMHTTDMWKLDLA